MCRRDVVRKGWKGLRKSTQVNQGLSTLEELNWIYLHKESKRGGGVDHIMINPKLGDFLASKK